MGRVIQLKNGETVSVVDEKRTLEDVIYQYLGIDCYDLFTNYIEGIIDERDEAQEAFRRLRGIL